ncbi:amidohydrolase family protein [Microbulbifer pacificus]|uniref:Amidohydrolase family protein n=1 Tax=Microbulbifer pacificus TaxID=407164 RepID=A0AAU0MUK8_9GAMM|nr:amidohydrolase family protein [Microbulbifer pacificus]WOX04147.1 amidohydrolase family protein [Microbulbifer pacificus]
MKIKSLITCMPLLFAALHSAANPEGAKAVGPIIDMHMHAGPGNENSSLYRRAPGETVDDASLRWFRAELDRYDVQLGLVGGPVSDALRFQQAAPERLWAGIIFPCVNGREPNGWRCFSSGADMPDLVWLRSEIEAGRIKFLGELLNVYAGVSPQDTRMMPYYDLAAEYDIPVSVHADEGPPPNSPVRLAGCCPDFNGDYANPALYRPLLEKYPHLRLLLMHTIRDESVSEAIKLMDDYPNVYMDTSPMSKVPREWVHASLKRITEAGHGDRIVFGSDYWGSIGAGIEVIESASFLTVEQKRGIYFDNAARFLRLKSEKEHPTGVVAGKN